MHRPSRRPAILLAAGLVVACATALFACEQGADLGPPEGWEAVSDTRWVRTGADTDAAFRDLETLDAMGVRLSDNDRVRYAQEQMTVLYRTHPEVFDSVFFAVAAPMFERDFAREGFQEAVDAAVQEAKRAINGQLYRQATALPDPPPEPVVYPDSLRARGVGGQAVVQAYVDAEGQALAVEVVESVHPALDAMVMRKAATTRYNPAWVVEENRAGRAIPNWVRLTPMFDPDA